MNTKNLIKILPSIGLLFLMLGCSDEPVITEDTLSSTNKSRTITSDEENISEINPTLIDDWENVQVIKLGTPGNHSVTAPWANGTSTNLSSEFIHDIRKADGWDMLFHTFKKKGQDEGTNYMCFYNKFTGILKIFYYAEKIDGATTTQWILEQKSGELLKMFDAPDSFSKADSELPNNSSKSLSFNNATNSSISGLTVGWNGFQYQISRYADESTNCDVSINAIDNTITSFEFLGKSNNLTTGTITSVTSTNKDIADGHPQKTGIITRSGQVASDLLSNMHKLSEVKFLSNEFRDLIGTVTNSDKFKAITEGLKFIFKRSTVTTLYTTSDVYLETTGTITTTGTGTSNTQSQAKALSFNLSSILKNGSKQGPLMVTPNQLPDYENLGVWTLKKRPKVYYYRVSAVWPQHVTITHSNNYVEVANLISSKDNEIETQSVNSTGVSLFYNDGVEVTGEVTVPPFRYDLPEIIFNPAIKNYLKSYNTDIKFFNCKKINGNAYNPGYEDIYGNGAHWTEMVYSDSEKEIKSPNFYGDFQYRTVFSSEQLNIDDTKNWYFDWGTILVGKLIAYVTVNMDFNYQGKEFKVSETRVYPVDYGYDPGPGSSYFHHPPYDFVINYYDPWRDDLRKYYGNDPSRVP